MHEMALRCMQATIEQLVKKEKEMTSGEGSNQQVCALCVCMYVCMCVCMCVFMFVCMYIYIYIYMYVYMHACMHTNGPLPKC